MEDEDMDIGSLWFTQRTLHRSYNIKELMNIIRGGWDFSTPIMLQESGDGEVEIMNGHHRIVAFWLMGVRELQPHQYKLQFSEQAFRRIWQVRELAGKTKLLEIEDSPYPCG